MIRGALLAASLVALATPAHAGPAQIVHTSVPSKGGPARNLTVILPAGYDARSARRYPVLYLLDGQNLVSHPIHIGGWRAAEGLAHAMQPNAGHDELAWAAFFPRGLAQLFPAR